MRQVTLLDLAKVQDPIVRAALQELMKASADNVISDVAESGAALVTLKNAAADEVPYFTGPTDVALAAFTAFARTLTACADAAAVLSALGISGSSVYLQVAQNLADLANAATARTNLGVTATGADTTYAFRANNLSDLANIATAVANLGLTIGTNVQAFDAQLSSTIPIVSKSADGTFALTDGEKAWYHPSSDNNPRTWTIPANASVAFPTGTAITAVNRVNTISLAITTDTLLWMPTQTTGTRTLAAGAQVTILKVESTVWTLSGVGIS